MIAEIAATRGAVGFAMGEGVWEKLPVAAIDGTPLLGVAHNGRFLRDADEVDPFSLAVGAGRSDGIARTAGLPHPTGI